GNKTGASSPPLCLTLAKLFIHRCQPLTVIGQFTSYGSEVKILQLTGHRTATTFADLAAIQFADRQDFSGRTGKESFVGDIDFIARNTLFFDGIASFSCELNNRRTRNAVQTRG